MRTQKSAIPFRFQKRLYFENTEERQSETRFAKSLRQQRVSQCMLLGDSVRPKLVMNYNELNGRALLTYSCRNEVEGATDPGV